MIIPIWAREQKRYGNVKTFYQTYEILADSRETLKGGAFQSGVREHETLSDVAEYITSSHVNRHNDSKFTVLVDTSPELYNTFVIGKEYIKRKLSDEEMSKLQKEILARLEDIL